MCKWHSNKVLTTSVRLLYMVAGFVDLGALKHINEQLMSSSQHSASEIDRGCNLSTAGLNHASHSTSAALQLGDTAALRAGDADASPVQFDGDTVQSVHVDNVQCSVPLLRHGLCSVSASASRPVCLEWPSNPNALRSQSQRAFVNLCLGRRCLSCAPVAGQFGVHCMTAANSHPLIDGGMTPGDVRYSCHSVMANHSDSYLSHPITVSNAYLLTGTPTQIPHDFGYHRRLLPSHIYDHGDRSERQDWTVAPCSKHSLPQTVGQYKVEGCLLYTSPSPRDS